MLEYSRKTPTETGEQIMKKHRIPALILVVAVLFSLLCLPAAATEVSTQNATADLQLQCKSAILIDANHGQILYEQHAYEKAFPASLTKIMTMLLTLEAIDAGTISTDTMVTVSDYAAQIDFAGESTADLKSGEQLSVIDLLYCLMLPSANDAAKALAEHIGGSVDSFVEMMNRRAAELGCQNTQFLNPNGVQEQEHYSCAYDIALMFRQAMSYELFLKIIGTAEYTISATNLSEARTFQNTNGLISELHSSGYVYDKCIGGKTGSTLSAGKCLVSAANNGEFSIISVIMGSDSIVVQDGSTREGHFVETTRLFEYGFQNFQSVTLPRTNEVAATVEVALSEDGNEVALIPQGTISLVVPTTAAEDMIRTQVTLTETSVTAPVEKGQVMGTVRFYQGDEAVGELDLVTERSMSFSKKLLRKQNRKEFWEKNGGWIITVLILIPVLPIVALCTIRFINIQRAKRRRQRRKAAARARIKK